MKNLIIRQFELGPLANYNYLLGDRDTGAAVIIDPSDEVAPLLEELKKNQLKLSAVLLTHGHYDHVGGAADLAAEHDIPVYLSEHEAPFHTPRCKNLTRTKDGEKIKVGSLVVECLHTPGHTPGCQCFLVEGNLFTGDTLFIDAIGRIDLPGGNARAMVKSLQRIKLLPDDTVIWPGHHYGEPAHEKLGVLKRGNPYLADNSEKNIFG
jgi:glyoxylase-like metal-dependent hydrolase (beta-lactamase superfamily II)